LRVNFSLNVTIFHCRYPVSPFIPKTRICFFCFHVGHLSKTCKSRSRCIYSGKASHNMGEECTLKSSPPCCINCKDVHLPISHNCPTVIKHKMAVSLVSTENIPIEKKKIAVSLSSDSASFTDPRYDFQNLPNLLNRQQFLPSYCPFNRSLIQTFSVLANLPMDCESTPRRTFSSMAAHPLGTYTHPTERSSKTNSATGHVPRREDPR